MSGTGAPGARINQGGKFFLFLILIGAALLVLSTLTRRCLGLAGVPEASNVAKLEKLIAQNEFCHALLGCYVDFEGEARVECAERIKKGQR